MRMIPKRRHLSRTRSTHAREKTPWIRLRNRNRQRACTAFGSKRRLGQAMREGAPEQRESRRGGRVARTILVAPPCSESECDDTLKLRPMGLRFQLIPVLITRGGALLAVAMRLKMARRADTAESTDDWILCQEYSRRMKSSRLSSMSAIPSRQTDTASAMIVVPMI
jgi:hypothetical protein